MDKAEVSRRLYPFAEELLTAIYSRIVEGCRKEGVVPVWIYLPSAEPGANDRKTGAVVRRIATQAGFEIVDLSGLFGDYDVSTLWIAEWDHHPNEIGHRVIAESIHARLGEDPSLSANLGLGEPAPGS